MAGNLTRGSDGEEKREGLCGLGCRVVLQRGFSVSLDNFELSYGRDV